MNGDRASETREEAVEPVKDSYRLGVVGFGVVGEAVAKGFSHLGHKVYVHDIENERLGRAKELGFKVSDGKRYDISEADVTFLMLPTPTTHLPYPSYSAENNIEILKFVVGKIAEEELSRYDKYHLFVNRSTSMPGTTRGLGKIIEDRSGKKIGREFNVAMNPEFLRAYRAEQDFLHPKLTVLGVQDDVSAAILKHVYRGINAPIKELSLEQAEWIKYQHNTFNAVKISYANEIFKLMRSSGLTGREAEEVSSTASRTAEGYWNPEYGIHGGRPFEGTCLPKDLQALIDYGKLLGVPTPILTAASEVNEYLLASKRSSERKGVKMEFSEHNYFSERDHETYHSDGDGNKAEKKQRGQVEDLKD